MTTWFRFVYSHIEQTSSLGLLRTIAPLLAGVDRIELMTTNNMLDQLLSLIVKPDYTENTQVNRRNVSEPV
jgi:hypothetical protein